MFFCLRGGGDGGGGGGGGGGAVVVQWWCSGVVLFGGNWIAWARGGLGLACHLENGKYTLVVTWEMSIYSPSANSNLPIP